MRAQRLIRWVSVFLIGAFGLLALDSLQLVDRYQNAGRAVLSPFSWAASSVADQALGFWATITEIGTLEYDNRQLRQENQRLVAQNLQLQAQGRENAALRQLLGYKQAHPGHTYLPAEIIAQGTNNFEPMLTVDQGSSNGIKEGMAVVDAGGLIGQITRVGAYASVVTPIFNPDSAVAAYVNPSTNGPSGIVDYESGVGLLLQDVDATAPLQTGDWVVTSGLGGTFPRDIPIGKITQISQRAVDMFQIAELQPAADVQHDRTVLVVTDFVPHPLPSAAS